MIHPLFAMNWYCDREVSFLNLIEETLGCPQFLLTRCFLTERRQLQEVWDQQQWLNLSLLYWGRSNEKKLEVVCDTSVALPITFNQQPNVPWRGREPQQEHNTRKKSYFEFWLAKKRRDAFRCRTHSTRIYINRNPGLFHAKCSKCFSKFPRMAFLCLN